MTTTNLVLAVALSFPFISLLVPVAGFLLIPFPKWKHTNLCRLVIGIGCIINALGFYAYGYVNDVMWKSYLLAPIWLPLAVVWCGLAFWAQRWEREKKAILKGLEESYRT